LVRSRKNEPRHSIRAYVLLFRNAGMPLPPTSNVQGEDLSRRSFNRVCSLCATSCKKVHGERMNAQGSPPRPPPATPDRPRQEHWEHGKNGVVCRADATPDQWWASMPHMHVDVELLTHEGQVLVARREYSKAPNCGWKWVTACFDLTPDYPLLVAWRPLA